MKPNHRLSRLSLLAVFTVFIILSGCYYDNEEELYQFVQAQQCDTNGITYTNTIAPLMTASCISCHSAAAPSGNIALDSYAGVKTAAANGKLYGSLSWASGYSPMPKGGNKLSDCDLSKVKAWINAGMPE